MRAMAVVFQWLFALVNSYLSSKRYSSHDATVTRQSQIAAVLLFDLRTVDIR